MNIDKITLGGKRLRASVYLGMAVLLLGSAAFSQQKESSKGQDLQATQRAEDQAAAEDIKNRKAYGDLLDKQSADDLKKRKEYGDKMEKEQKARDAKAIKDAIENEEWHKKHDAWEKQKEDQARKEHDERTREREEEDKRLNLGTSEKHLDWEARRDQRKQQQAALMKQMDESLASEPDEQRRHALADSISQQLQKLHQDQKLDTEPK